MPAEGSVKMIWQIIFSFIPILDLWSRYRIKKLRKYLLYIYLPVIVLPTVFIAIIVVNSINDPNFVETMGDSDSMFVVVFTMVFSVMSIGFTILSIYLVYKWTIAWNKQFGVSSYDSE